MRTICVFTGTRAEYGLLRPLIQRLSQDSTVTLKLLVSGTHLSPMNGETWQEIAKDGIAIDETVEVVQDSGTATGIYTAMGLGLIRYGDALRRMRPDMLVLLGDRFEAFAAAAAATACNIPVAHLHGGELTFGAIDEAFRHAITKMSHLHFTSTEAYRQRVIQLGEAPDTVFDVGALGVENIHTLTLLSPEAVAARLNLSPGTPFLLLTYHPETLGPQPEQHGLEALFEALDAFPDHAVVFTGANADAGGARINRTLIDRVAQSPQRYRFFQSLGATLYLSAARCAAAVIGNSSSGIIEVPSFGVPSIDIGTRQAGRTRSSSVISCDPTADAIQQAIATALSSAFRQHAASVVNPYDRPGTADHIAKVLATYPLKGLLNKTFHDIDVSRSK